jgi:hypothetical protein
MRVDVVCNCNVTVRFCIGSLPVHTFIVVTGRLCAQHGSPRSAPRLSRHNATDTARHEDNGQNSS